MFRRLLVAVVAAAALFLSPSTGSASTIFYFTQTDVSGTSPFGEVKLTQNGADSLDVLVTLYDGNRFVDTGGPHFPFGFNLAGNPSLSVGTEITDLTPNFLYTTPVSSGTLTPYGDFQYVFAFSGNGAPYSQPGPLAFTLNLAGITPNSFIPSTGQNAGYYFAADILTAGPSGSTGSRAALGPGVDDGFTSTAAVPEPASLTLLGTGLALAARRYRKRRA